MLRRYQVAGTYALAWSKLLGPTRARQALYHRLKGFVFPMTWIIKPDGKERIERTTHGRARTALAMVADAKTRHVPTRYKVKGADSPIFRLLIGAEYDPWVPAQAATTTATKRTVAYGQELTLVYPEWRSLGLYVNKQVLGTSYWSEHGWAAAQDAGVRDQDGEGFETDALTRKFFLDQFHRYTLANAHRLKVIDHIYNETRYRAETNYKPERYGGTDNHATHTHTAFADHDGKKPPWT